MGSVTVALYGGLGNQMFQYAMGRALALRHNVALKLDIYGFEFDTYYKRHFELGHFSIPHQLTKVRKPIVFHVSRAMRRLSYSRKLFSCLLRPWLLIESGREYDPQMRIINAANDVFVMGYWQDERYFLEFRDEIRGEFVLADSLSAANRKLAAQISSSPNPVAVHVRRLHEVPSTPNGKLNGNSQQNGRSLGRDYYVLATKELSTYVKNPAFFVFSDYPKWSRENIGFDGATTYLENDRGPDHEDMILMSLCHHHVIANSSFSWWGAWLANYPGQVAITPRMTSYMPNVPARWLRM
ncbi:MAG TPA: alpha-1,2-fucosyltransferase [Burkholderiales bacterium]|nr:alpha-1,2-fucosyltransferase [Burkholderiales bacterium]